jgi:hypothetical protein
MKAQMPTIVESEQDMNVLAYGRGGGLDAEAPAHLEMDEQETSI